MAIGFRAFIDFQRADPALVEGYRGITSANIGDSVLRMNCMFGGIHAFNNKPLVGTAFTVKVPSGDNLVAQMTLDYAKPGDIIVIDGAGYTDRALVGDADGIVVIPQRDAADVLEAARQNLANEQAEMQRMRDGSYTQQNHLKAFTGHFLEQGGKIVDHVPYIIVGII